LTAGAAEFMDYVETALFATLIVLMSGIHKPITCGVNINGFHGAEIVVAAFRIFVTTAVLEILSADLSLSRVALRRQTNDEEGRARKDKSQGQQSNHVSSFLLTRQIAPASAAAKQRQGLPKNRYED
jgi:hypothetical protein